MYVYDETDQPYGLLSIMANTPFVFQGKTYQSAAECIYVTMSRSEADVDPFQVFKNNPSDAMHGLVAAENTYLFNEYKKYLLEGYDQMLAGKILRQYKGYTFVWPDRQFIADHLNLKIAETTIPLITIKKIVEGVRKQLTAGKDIQNNPTIIELEQYAIDEQPTITDDDPALKHLTQLVPYIKFELGEARSLKHYETELAKFKYDLLNKMIEYTIVTSAEGKAVDVKAEKAKATSQISTELMAVQAETVYKDYLDGKIKKDVLDKMTVKHPRLPPFVFDPPPQKTITLTATHELSPYNDVPIVMGGTTYSSPLIYANSMMYQLVSSDTNVNTIPKEKLSAALGKELNDEYIPRRIRTHVVNAMSYKFINHPVLLELLKTTGKEPIYYADKEDPMLGIGKDKNGRNIVGNVLETFRTKENKYKYKYYSLPLDNIYLKSWVLMRMKDILNMMTMFKKPTVDIMQTLYRFPPGRTQMLHYTYDWTKVFPNATPEMILDAFALIYPQVYALQQLYDEQLTSYVVAAQKRYLGPLPNDKVYEVVEKYLRYYFGKYKDRLTTNSVYDFASRVLSDDPHTTANSFAVVWLYAKQPRIMYWYELAKLKN